MKSALKILFVFLSAILFSIIVAYLFPGSDLLYSFSKWRVSGFIEKGIFFIFLNNIMVLFLVLFGGIIASLMEIKSYENLPCRLYSFLDLLSFPLHKIFSIFDQGINSLEKPMKSCYFLSVSFPVMVLFFNVFLFFGLLFYLFSNYGINPGTQSFILDIMPIALIEFFCIFIAAFIAYDFTQRNYHLFRDNKIQEFRKISKEYISSKKNWILFITLSCILIISAFVEYFIIG